VPEPADDMHETAASAFPDPDAEIRVDMDEQAATAGKAGENEFRDV